MIVLFSDFGLEGPYIGQVKAELMSGAPGVPVVDLFADLPPFRILEASYLLATYAPAMPVGAVLLCVVDPGVGSDRASIAALIDGRWYVGPDNGIMEISQRRARSSRIFKIVTSRPASATFHGRDVFAPAAARLARGDRAGLFEVDDFDRHGEWPDDLAAVTYIDRFGNLFTGMRANSLSAKTILSIKGHKAHRARTFSDVGTGELLWYENSNGLAEIALNQGNAAKQLGIDVGCEIVTEMRPICK